MRDLEDWTDLLKKEAQRFAVEEMENFIKAYEQDDLMMFNDSNEVRTCAMAAMGGGGREGYHSMLSNYGPLEVEFFFEGFGESANLVPDAE